MNQVPNYGPGYGYNQAPYQQHANPNMIGYPVRPNFPQNAPQNTPIQNNTEVDEDDLVEELAGKIYEIIESEHPE